MTKIYLRKEEKQRPQDDYDERDDYTTCPDCGEDLEHHDCKVPRIRALNDEFRTTVGLVGAAIAKGDLFVTRGIATRGKNFVDRAVKAVREFSDFTEDNDPYREHDCANFTLDDAECMWKIDYYDNDLNNGSPDAADPSVTRRVLTILLAEEY